MLIVITIQSILCIILIGFIYKQFKNSLNTELSDTCKKREDELLSKQIELAKFEERNQSLSKNIIQKDEKIEILEKVIKIRDDVIIELKAQNSFLSGENENLKKENHDKKILESKLKEIELENKKNAVEIEEKKKNIQNLVELQEQIKNQFKVMSNEIIREQKESFNKEQNESLEHLLVPLNKDIKEFKDKIQQAQEGNKENTAKIEQHIKDLMDTTKDIGNKADNLATALKGDKKAQGNWGEFQLQNLLEMSGLEEGVSFFKQYNIKNFDGKDFFLDFLIKLPEERILIVDSKVSMTNYEKYINTSEENYLKTYCNDIKNHIKELGTKEYQNIYKEYNKKTSKDTPDFVFMFVALESAYIDTIKFDRTIFDTAMDNKVAIVTTSSFMPVLRMIEHLWRVENQNKNISEIVELAQKMCSKVEKFSKDMKTIGDNLDKAKSAYESAKSYISTGNANILSTTNKIIKLAEKGKKNGTLALNFDDED